MERELCEGARRALKPSLYHLPIRMGPRGLEDSLKRRPVSLAVGQPGGLSPPLQCVSLSSGCPVGSR